MKRCTQCGVNKPLGEFYRCKRLSDGRTPECAACRRESTRLYRVANPDALKRWKAENPDRVLQHKETLLARLRAETVSRHVEPRNCEECDGLIAQTAPLGTRFCSKPCGYASKYKRWASANPDLVRAKDLRRRSRKRGAFVENVSPLVVLEIDDGMCGICGKDVDPLNFHVDHIVPLARGGEHSCANTQVAHPTCNQRKHVVMPWDEVA
jgi:5-methylcytosine-specific restriction endonuclease McrA